MKPDLDSLLQSMEAHAGFLNSAVELRERVSTFIDEVTKSRALKHVVFTGHSAGAAVASLLYLSFRAHSSEDCRYAARDVLQRFTNKSQLP